MKLELKPWERNEYWCDLTRELDELAGIRDIYQEMYDEWGYRHYVLIWPQDIHERCFAIRIPGGTVGAIWFDENNQITKIVVDTDYVVKTYPANVNQIIQKYVGQTIEW